MKIEILVGSGRKLGLFASPFIVLGVILNILFPSMFSVGGPSKTLVIISVVMLALGLINWIWTVVLILTMIPKKKLITTGPYRLVKHPLYNGMGILVLPWLGFLLNTWVGIVIGLSFVIGSQIYSKEEEGILSNVFKDKWEEYKRNVLIPWL